MRPVLLLITAATIARCVSAAPSLTWFETTPDSRGLAARTASYRIPVSSEGWTMPGGLAVRFSGARSTPGELDSASPVSLAYLPPEPSLRRRISGSARALFPRIYPGIDLRYRFSEGLLEYDLLLDPRVKIGGVRLSSNGVMTLAGDGTLTIRRGSETIRKQPPVAWQEIGSERRTVTARYRRCGRDICFTLGPHDPDRPLVIDPVISYATYYGTANADFAYTSVSDSAGNLYIGGTTDASSFPFSAPAPPELPGGSGQGAGFVAKFSVSGQLVYAVDLAANSVQKLAIDTDGSLYVVSSSNYGTGAISPAWYLKPPSGTLSSLLLKLNAPGNDLIYATFTPGTVAALLPGPWGNVYLAGNFQLKNARAASEKIVELSSAGTEALAITNLETPLDSPTALALDPAGNVIVGGSSSSTAPRMNGALQQNQNSRAEFASNDGGQTWAPAASEIRTNTVYQDQAVSGRLWAILNNQLFSSTDFGKSWQARASFGSNVQIEGFQTVPGNPDLLFVLAASGLLKTGDGGVTWSAINIGYVGALAIDPNDTNNMLLQGFFQLLQTRDGGKTLAPVFTSPQLRLSPTPVFAVIPGMSPYAFVVVGGAGVFQYNFATGLLAEVSNIPVANPFFVAADPVHAGEAYFAGFGATGFVVYSTAQGTLGTVPGGYSVGAPLVVPDPVDVNVLYVWSGYGYLKTADGGKTWQPLALPSSPNQTVALLINPRQNNQLLFFRSPAGNAFLTSFAPDLSGINASTWLGGDGDESLSSIAAGPDGLITVMGTTSSLDIALIYGGRHADGTTDHRSGFNDIFAARLTPDLSTQQAFRLVGGSGQESGTFAQDSTGNIVVGGSSSSPDFPTAGRALGAPPKDTTSSLPFFAAFDLNLNILYSSFLNMGNASGGEFGAPDPTPDGRVWIAGDTQSTNLPATSGAQFPHPIGYEDIYIMLLDWRK